MKEVIFEVTDVNRCRLKNNTEGGYYWTSERTTENQYCYTVMIPLHKSEQERRQIVAKDLHHWLSSTLDIAVNRERRWVNCLVLRRQTRQDELFRSMKDTMETVLTSNEKKQFIHVPFIRFVNYLNNEDDGNPYIFNETGIPDSLKVDLDFNIQSFADLASFRKALCKYGLELVEKKREMYIITEKNGTEPTAY